MLRGEINQPTSTGFVGSLMGRSVPGPTVAIPSLCNIVPTSLCMSGFFYYLWHYLSYATATNFVHMIGRFAWYLGPRIWHITSGM
jgi:hypothetical protein